MDSFSVRGIWEYDLFAGFYGTGTENHGKTEIPRESFGLER